MMAEACPELIGAGEAKAAEADARFAIRWYPRTWGPPCAAGHRDGTLIEVSVTVEEGEFEQGGQRGCSRRVYVTDTSGCKVGRHLQRWIMTGRS
jgi:hypothetical protein